LVIKNGRIVDGTGNPWFKEDVGIANGRIVKIGNLGAEESKRVVDAKGLVVAPGFIDMHSHSDLSPLINPRTESKVRQGITTEVVGNCGVSAAPLNDFLKEEIMKTTPILEEAGLELDWSTMNEYLCRLDEKKMAVNVVSLVGHGNVRAMVMKYDVRPPTKNELEEMRKVLAKALEEGGFGLSSGLIYPPGCYANTNELIELCKVVAQYDGLYSSHIRGEEERLIDSVKEAIKIGNKAGVPVEISHHKAAGKASWGKVKRTLRMIEETRERGVEVTCDVYPYLAGSFGLDAMLPPHAYEGGVEKLVERLKDEKTRQRLRREMTEGIEGWSSPLRAGGWDATMIAYCEGHPEFEGKTVLEITQQKDTDPFDFVFDLLIEERASVSVVRFLMREEDVRTVLKHPVSMIGSDSSARAPYGVLGKGKPHPRSYGTFPRVLGRYVKEEGVLTLENAIRKMTSLPAQKLQLRDRGLIREGMWADITIFNPKNVIDTATYYEPHRYPIGIEYVLVNGKVVIDNGEHTGELPGHALRRST
jgi:N-acyl-D-amino-acid deacylase